MTPEFKQAYDTDRAEALAQEIAQAFGDANRIDTYRRICQAHDRQTVYRAYRETADVPISKIKKSRNALFTYLIRKYEKEN